tara:strand:- start:263 stop:547 length:285 start_codon:yes stop_codon:yes gene_type:complete
MSKHSPGPWEITGQGRRPTPCTWVSLSPEDDGNSLEVVGADHEANARLIAEAPAMFDALLQYRDDMRYAPAEDSRHRRIEMVSAILTRIEGGAA